MFNFTTLMIWNLPSDGYAETANTGICQTIVMQIKLEFVQTIEFGTRQAKLRLPKILILKLIRQY